MKQKAVAMAAAFTMLLAAGVTGLGSEILSQHPAYANPSLRMETCRQAALSPPETETMLLAAPREGEK